MSNPHRIPRESLAVFRAAWEEEEEEDDLDEDLNPDDDTSEDCEYDQYLERKE